MLHFSVGVHPVKSPSGAGVRIAWLISAISAESHAPEPALTSEITPPTVPAALTGLVDMASQHTHPDSIDSGEHSVLAAMHKFQQGDEASFDYLCAEFWPAVWTRARKAGLSPAESDDVAQNTLIQFYVYAPRAEFVSHRQVWGYLYSIVPGMVARQWKQKFPGDLVGTLPPELGPTADPNENPVTVALNKELSAEIADCIEQLPEVERFYVRARLILKVTFRSAAKFFGLRLGQYKNRYEKALGKVQRCLKAKGHDFSEETAHEGPAGGLGVVDE